jgi:hypothetical protein
MKFRKITACMLAAVMIISLAVTAGAARIVSYDFKTDTWEIWNTQGQNVSINLKNNAAAQIVGNGLNPGTMVVPAGNGVFTTAEMRYIAEETLRGGFFRVTATVSNGGEAYGTSRALIGKDWGMDSVVIRADEIKDTTDTISELTFDIPANVIYDPFLGWNATGIILAFESPINPDTTASGFLNPNNWFIDFYNVTKWVFELIEGEGDSIGCKPTIIRCPFCCNCSAVMFSPNQITATGFADGDEIIVHTLLEENTVITTADGKTIIVDENFDENDLSITIEAIKIEGDEVVSDNANSFFKSLLNFFRNNRSQQ